MYSDINTNEILMDPFYPCIKYKVPADPKLDGTGYFIVAESMHLYPTVNYAYWLERFHCSISFTCENNQKAFYKLIKDRLRFQIKELSF